MLSFFHNFAPQAILLSFGWLKIYWYGLFVVSGIIAAMATARHYWKKVGLEAKLFDDLSFLLIIFGLIGARVYEWFLSYPYYSQYPGELLKIWHGGLAIHGAIIGAFLALWWFSRKHRLSLAKICAIIVPGLALGQAIGRFGNYFNQELFGWPTNLPWGIFISPENRPIELQQFAFFQPTFLYESMLCLLLFLLLILLKKRFAHQNLLVIGSYLCGYGLIRFFLEYLRIDLTPQFIGLRWPQFISIILFIIGSTLLYLNFFNHRHEKRTTKN
ncbi:MAG: prolipoprotein diacylglyceryl transferase [Candidatus Falkowbacteria bacterium]|nr:prolipoprotein diacylglyceryl transferase [Candidatus Falkowbacteria bacterium]